ncbi:hypothetical protein [Sorangium sp. So ce124]|uniref:hypothetical protein n=1 Tax=Sorangium sp. So ce124 TaxID=3133280 RepID=UPI003F61FDC6
MTLIVSAATTEYLLQAADRRLTRGHPVKDIRDDETKAVIFCNTAIFGFTGWAYVDDAQKCRTDHWLCEALAGSPNLYEQLPILKRRADETFAARREPLAFAATAWGARNDELSPFLVLVSNFHDTKTGKSVAEVRPEFDVLTCGLKDDKDTLFHYVGAELLDWEDDEVEGIMSGLSKRLLTVEQALWQIAHVIRRVADRDETVGRGILLTAISKKAALGEELAVTTYMPADTTTTVGKAPHFVCGGALMIEAQFHLIE